MARNRTPDDPTRDVAKHEAKPARKQGAKPIRRLC